MDMFLFGVMCSAITFMPGTIQCIPHMFLPYDPCSIGRAKASCASMIRTARDVVADIGEVAAARSGGLINLAKKRENNSERDCVTVMAKQCGLTLPLEQHYLELKDDAPKVPFLRFRDWLSMMMEHNCLHILSGLVRPDRSREHAIWTAFWKNYQRQEPEHVIFQRARDNQLDLGNCFAVVVHGDEGRSKKRNAFLVVNIHSVLGRGVEVGLRKAPRKEYIKMLPNLVGHSYTNRFLACAMHKSAYTHDNSYAFDVLLDTLCAELCYVANEGVVDRFGTRYWAFCIGVVGDWPWLAKSGGLERSFMNVVKHRDSGGGGGVRAACRGICHLCAAGQPQVPFEQIATRHPTWANTVLQQTPFSRPSPFRNLPYCPGENELARLFHFDLFHSWHLGLGKNYLGSMLAILSGREPGGNIDLRFAQMSQRYLDWCSTNKRTAHVQRLTKEMINWVSTTHYPTGSWHKGDLTTSLMLWVEARFVSENWSDNDELVLAGEAAVAANTFLRLLYSGGAWLSQSEAQEVANHGFRFMRRYSQCAKLAFQRNLRHWIIQPKAHAMHHLFMLLSESASRGPVLSLLCTSVQMDEDFIGRGSRLSRHVNETRVSERVVGRYLMSAYDRWVACGYLIRSHGS